MLSPDLTKVQLNFGLSRYLDRKFGLSLSLSKITFLFDLSPDLDRTLAQRKAEQKTKSKVKVTQWINTRGHKFTPGLSI